MADDDLDRSARRLCLSKGVVRSVNPMTGMNSTSGVAIV
jgi:hypothetical protein